MSWYRCLKCGGRNGIGLTYFGIGLEDDRLENYSDEMLSECCNAPVQEMYDDGERKIAEIPEPIKIN